MGTAKGRSVFLRGSLSQRGVGRAMWNDAMSSYSGVVMRWMERTGIAGGWGDERLYIYPVGWMSLWVRHSQRRLGQSNSY